MPGRSVSILRLAFFSALVFHTVTASADELSVSIPEEESSIDTSLDDKPLASKPLWEAGLAGLVMQQLAYPGSSVRTDKLLLLPYGIYRGEVLRAEEEGVAVRTIRHPRFEVNLGLAAAFGTDTDDIPVREGMSSLGFLAEIGPMLRVRLGSIKAQEEPRRHRWALELPIRTVWDFSHLRYRGISFEPRIVYRADLPGNVDFLATVGVLFGTRRLNDNFYGVEDEFALADRPAYQAHSGLVSSRINLTLGYRITPAVRLVTFWRGESIAGAENESSPLADQKNGWSAGLGFSWQVFKSPDAGSE